MGKYVYVSIATRIIVSKKDYFHYIISTLEIIEKMGHYFHLDLYLQSEDNNFVYFDLKETVIKDYLCSFLKEHTIHNTELHNVDKYLDNIKLLKNKTTSEVIKYIQNEDIDYFNFYNSCHLKQTYLDDELKLYFEGINYIFDETIFMGNCNQLFKYIHYRIRALQQNPLEGTTFIDMS